MHRFVQNDSAEVGHAADPCRISAARNELGRKVFAESQPPVVG